MECAVVTLGHGLPGLKCFELHHGLLDSTYHDLVLDVLDTTNGNSQHHYYGLEERPDHDTDDGN